MTVLPMLELRSLMQYWFLGIFSSTFPGAAFNLPAKLPVLWPPHLAMHIPDGFLNLPVSLITWLIAIGTMTLALKRVERDYQERTVPLMGVCAAFIFAAQMVNFPIPGGTSGHLLGGTLAGILLGPWAGTLVMSVVFIVQAVLFQDGGLTVLGANICNMGLIGTFGGYYLYKLLRTVCGQNSWRGMATATAVSAWTSVVAASLVTAWQIALSGTVPLLVATIAMVSWHVIIGIGEALITVAAVSFVWQSRPNLLYQISETGKHSAIGSQPSVKKLG